MARTTTAPMTDRGRRGRGLVGLALVPLTAGLFGAGVVWADAHDPTAPSSAAAPPAPVPTVPAEGSVRTVTRTISTAEAPRRIAVRRGALLELEVVGDVLDSVELLDEVSPIAPESPARFDIYADRPGEYPIELVDEGKRIGTLVVRP